MNGAAEICHRITAGDPTLNSDQMLRIDMLLDGRDPNEAYRYQP